MRVLKNGKNVPYLYGTDRLTPEQVQNAVDSMSYSSLQTAAASFFILAQAVGMTPCQMMEILEADNIEIIYKRRNQWNS